MGHCPSQLYNIQIEISSVFYHL